MRGVSLGCASNGAWVCFIAEEEVRHGPARVGKESWVRGERDQGMGLGQGGGKCSRCVVQMTMHWVRRLALLSDLGRVVDDGARGADQGMRNHKRI
jgi:hypothetical protein